jgi:hypothetical protein
MRMIRSDVIHYLEFIFYELIIVSSKLFNSCTQLLTNILLARNQYLPSPIPYLTIGMFLALLYVMGIATAVSIQFDLSHPSPIIIQLMCPYSISIS